MHINQTATLNSSNNSRQNCVTLVLLISTCIRSCRPQLNMKKYWSAGHLDFESAGPDLNAMHFAPLPHIINTSMQSLRSLQATTINLATFWHALWCSRRVWPLWYWQLFYVLTTENKRTPPFLSLWASAVYPDLLQWLHRSMCVLSDCFMFLGGVVRTFIANFFPYFWNGQNYIGSNENGKTLFLWQYRC